MERLSEYRHRWQILQKCFDGKSFLDIEDDVIVDIVSIRGESDRCIITISHRVYRYDRLLSDTQICYNVTPGGRPQNRADVRGGDYEKITNDER